LAPVRKQPRAAEFIPLETDHDPFCKESAELFFDRCLTKKADVPEHPKEFDHVGLLVNEPPG
jgi:hypothetical protein